jgi:hypothetical protein
MQRQEGLAPSQPICFHEESPMNTHGKRALSLDEVYFRPVAGGYLYDAPDPWLRGRGARYLVDEEQRAALLAIVRPQRNGLRIVVLNAMVLPYVIAVALLWSAVSNGHMANLAMAGMTLTTLVPFYLVGVAYRFRYLARIAPVVSNAIETDATFTTAERYRAIGDRLPLWVLILAAVFWPFQAITTALSILARANSHTLVNDVHLYTQAFIVIAGCAMTAMVILALVNRRRPQA